MIPTKISIEKIDNGFIITYQDYYSDSDDKFEAKTVISEGSTTPYTKENEHLDECKALRELVFVIFDKLGYHSSDHDAYICTPVVKDMDGKEIEIDF